MFKTFLTFYTNTKQKCYFQNRFFSFTFVHNIYLKKIVIQIIFLFQCISGYEF